MRVVASQVTAFKVRDRDWDVTGVIQIMAYNDVGAYIEVKTLRKDYWTTLPKCWIG